MLTQTSAYHTGFNMGFNMAEAVNYCTPEWLNVFTKMRRCRCQSGTVIIDPELFYENLVKSRLIRRWI